MEIKKGEHWRVMTIEGEEIIQVQEDIPNTDEDFNFKSKVFNKGKSFDLKLNTKKIRWIEKKENN